MYILLLRSNDVFSQINSTRNNEKQDLRALLKDVAGEVLNDPGWYDKMILKEIKQSSSVMIRRFHFHAFFKHGLNQTLLHLIDSRQNDFKELLSAPILVNRFRASEDVIIKLLEIYKEEIEKTLGHRTTRNENLLHVLIDKGFQNAISCLFSFYDVASLCFQHNLAGDTPLMTMIPKELFSLEKITTWNCMVKNGNMNDLLATITHTNEKGSNILHLCAENTSRKENESSILLREICTHANIPKTAIIKALNTDRKGKLPFYLCEHEDTCLALLDIMPLQLLQKQNIDGRKNNIMHICGSKKHFPILIKKLGQRLPRNELQDLLFERNDNGNNPMMACAIRDGHEILAQFLFMIFLKGDNFTRDRIDDLLHRKNKRNNTLLSLTLQHKGTTEIPLQLLLKMEKDHHQNNLSEVNKCFKKHLRPSLEVWQALSEIEESYPKVKLQILIIWLTTFFFSMLWPTFWLSVDVGSDYYLLDEYHPDGYNSNTSSLFHCQTHFDKKCNNSQLNLPNFEDICKMPQKLPKSSRFYYLLSFILMPHFFYSLEFLQAVEFHNMWNRITKVSMGISKTSPFLRVKNMFLLLLYFVLLILKLIFWPLYMIWKSFISDGKAATSSGQNYFRLTRMKDENMILAARSRIIEACTEASFQPMLVLYMALPDILTIFTHAEEGPDCKILSGIEKNQQIAYRLMTNRQIFSIFGSIVSLVLSFDMYYEAQKMGALGLAGNFGGRIIRLFSTLLLVISRLLALVLCAYCFGEGFFYPMIILVSCHIILMSCLHYATSYEWEIVMATGNNRVSHDLDEADELTLTTFMKFKANMIIAYQCLINGIGNVYIHNWIVNYHSRQFGVDEKKTTLLRQLITELIFAAENIAIVVMTSRSENLQNLPRVVLNIILVFHLLGIFLKIVYYHFWHIWSYAFDVVTVEYIKGSFLPHVSIAIPYYFFGRSGVLRFGSKRMFGRHNQSLIDRPTVDMIFDRQSVASPSILKNKNQTDYIHLHSLRTSSEKELISAIVKASNSSAKGNLEHHDADPEIACSHELQISELHTLFTKFLSELEVKQRTSRSMGYLQAHSGIDYERNDLH